VAAPMILIVDDEPGIRFGVRDFLESHAYTVQEAEDCASAERLYRATRPDAVVMDYRLPDGDALSLLATLRQIDPDPAHIVLTGHGSIDLAVRAIKEGAEHFLTKPVDMGVLLTIVARIAEARRSRKQAIASTRANSRRVVDPFVGTSQAIRALADQARKWLESDSPMLIQGETGTGKGVLARWLHRNGPNSREAFVDLNCAGLSRDFLESELFGHDKGAYTGAVSAKPGLFEVADRGTLLLDEFGDLALELQPRLLTAIEEKRFRRLGEVRERTTHARLIAATNQDLRRKVAEGQFRSDLYYRISALPLTVPPLRSRIEDVGLITEVLIAELSSELGRKAVRLSKDAESALRAYPWPGNIRELRNVLDRAILLGEDGLIQSRHLRLDEAPMTNEKVQSTGDLSLEDVERRHIEKVLQQTGGQVNPAAEKLGIPRSTLYLKIKRYGLSASRS
jgi:DNA-binding NtrC family response regulator